jgi:hypothetical protein
MTKLDRHLICGDAIEWLQSNAIAQDASIIASMPDISEFPQLSLSEWKNWFGDTAEIILKATPENQVTIFYQSDIKYEGEWVDKSFIIQSKAQKLGHKLLWHKIACRHPVDTVTFGRPSYSHILCFSKKLNLDMKFSTADVLGDIGEQTWVRGMGFQACAMIAKFLKNQAQTSTLIHPFCGEGSMIAWANHVGLSAIGIDRSPKRIEKAKSLVVDEQNKSWK